MMTAGVRVAAERADYPGFVTPAGSAPAAWSRTTEGRSSWPGGPEYRGLIPAPRQRPGPDSTGRRRVSGHVI